ncbi:MAG: LytTR family DNA-binding domain-containing protein [Bacteroidota bacterium]
MLKAIIIDDEMSCIETLKLMLEKKFSSLIKIVATASVPSTGIDLINTHQPDILFLDVEMPEMTGIELLQSLEQVSFHVIFTTAHQHYAIQAIRLNALDYLTKPISLEELTSAIHKCAGNKKSGNNELMNNFLQQLKTNSGKKIQISNNTTVQFVPVCEIVRVESQSNYSVIFFTNRPKQTVTKTLKELEEQLSPYNFLRVHHSHLVNIDHVIGYKNQDSGYVIVYGNDVIEISRRKKQEVLEKLNAI